MANHSQTSTGERLTDAQIKIRYAASRKKKYEGSNDEIKEDQVVVFLMMHLYSSRIDESILVIV